MPSRKAVVLASTILMTGKVKDDKTDLNTFFYSSMKRCRRENRSVLFEYVKYEFI